MGFAQSSARATGEPAPACLSLRVDARPERLGLSKEELRTIRPEADAAYDEAIGRLETARRGGREPDYREVIRDALLSVLERRVTPERMTAIRTDLRLRERVRKDAAVDMLAALLDRELLLSETQRRQIAEALSAGWDDRWNSAIEMAMGGNVVIPDIPERLVPPFLGAGQTETWWHLQRLWGRHWSVNFDHGRGPAIDQELGAAPPPRIVAVAPRPVWRTPAVVIADERVQRVVRQPLIVVAHGEWLQPAGGDADDGDDEANPAALLRRRREQELREARRAANLQAFDRYLFGNRPTQQDARIPFETGLSKRIDYLARACGLTDLQKKKLQVAGQGDIKRFFDRVAEARRGIQSIDDGRRLVIGKVYKPLADELSTLLVADGPILGKALARTLTDGQRTVLEKDAGDRRVFRNRAAVRWTVVLLARSLGLLDEPRRRLELLLLEETIPPIKFDSFDYWLVMYQASRIREARMRPIFDDVQWRVMTQELTAARQWRRHFEKGGFLPREMFDDHQDAAFPDIQVLQEFDTNVIRP